MKCYLAKSNRANPTLVSNVRHELHKKFTIIEYTGGNYTHKLLCNSDFVVAIMENDYKYLGKGIYTQIYTALINDIPVFLFTSSEKLIYIKNQSQFFYLTNKLKENSFVKFASIIKSNVCLEQDTCIFSSYTQIYDFISLKECNTENNDTKYPMTFSEAYKYNIKLLLLKH